MQSACIHVQIRGNLRLLIGKLLTKNCLQYTFPIIFVLDPDGTGSIGHVTLHLNILIC